MEGDRSDLEAAARDYEAKLPHAIDVLLLGLGDDGHIASLFPDSPVFSEPDRLVVPVTGSTAPHDRLTITPPVVTSANRIFLLAPGKEKGRVLAEALRAPDDIRSFPVLLTLRGTWLLDAEAVRQVETALHDGI
jgi:6-phosphogluconolactonase